MKRIVSLLLVLLLVCLTMPVCAAAAVQKPTNVILMIGDGMGWNHLQLAKQERGIRLFTEENYDILGWSQTRSASNKVTDSAAGGTALSSGVRTVNRYVATYVYDPVGVFTVPVTLCEAAKASGRLSGVVTTDATDGATPAAFTAHTNDRGNSADISRQQAKSDLDLIWGGVSSTFSASLAESNGFTVITSEKEMNALKPGAKSFGQFDADEIWQTKVPDGSPSPTLSKMTKKAISLLDNENGFFLMVEGAHIDKKSHNNEADKAAEAVEEFDKAIRTAVDFAKKDGNTLVVVTADHETGGLQLIDGKYTYTTTSHTGVDVPVIVFGSKDFIGADEHIKNKEVSQRIGDYLSLGDAFPHKQPGKLAWFLADVRKKLSA